MEAQKRDLDSFFNKWIYKFNKFYVRCKIKKKGYGKLPSFSLNNYVNNDAIYWDGKGWGKEGWEVELRIEV